MKIFFLIFLFVCTLFAQIDVEDAWQLVKSKNSSLAASENELSHAKLQKESSDSMHLPSISIVGSYTHLDDEISADTSKISSFAASLPIPLPFPSEIDFSKQDIFLANLHLLWPLYTGGKIDAAQDIYASKVDEAQALHEMHEDKLFLKFVKYYYGVVVSKALYETRLEVQKALNLHYEHAKKLKDEGQIANIELLNAKVKLDAAKIETTKAKHKLQIVKSAFFSLLKEKKEPDSKLFVNVDFKSREFFETQTLQNYAALEVLDAKLKQTDSLLQIKKAAWHPEVVAYGNYNLYKDDSPLMDLAPKWMVGVMVKFDILNTKDRSKEIQSTKSLNSKVKNLKLQAMDDLKLLVEKTYNEMLLYKDEYNSLNSSLALALENYRVRELAFMEGLATSIEVVDAQMFLEATKTKRLNAAYNYLQRVAQLCVLSGERNLFFEIESISEGLK